MTDHDRRGAYTPPNDEPLHFDARRPRSGGGGSPPTTLLISAVVLLVLVGGAFAYYRSGIRHDGQAPAVVGTPVGETKTQAPASAQPADPAEGLQVYNSETPQTTAPAPTLAPAPEEPMPRVTAPKATAPVEQNVLPAAPAAKAAAEAPAPRAAPAKPVKMAEAAPAPEPVRALPAKPKPAPAPVEKAAKAKAEAAPAKAKAVAAGAAAVQIGAFSSSAQADKGWNAVARVSPTHMLGKGKRVETVDKGGQTFYRTFVTGFASHDAAAAFCNELKAAGKTCLVK
jgi:cell division protein FtsN